MGSIIFILGGVRSGKSRYALELAKSRSDKVAYIATCTNPDKEMKQRIRAHHRSRPGHWKVIEEAQDIVAVLNKLKNKFDTVVIDCLGLWISNLLLQDCKDQQILSQIKRLSGCLPGGKAATIVVSNEVGAGVVPDNLLARRFRDLLGLANQMLAQKADQVVFMQSGIALKIKDSPPLFSSKTKQGG